MRFLGTGLVFVTALFLSSSAGAINITSENDGNVLANAIAGSGVTIDSVSYVGADGQAGTFTDGNSSGIGIEEGIILTSGLAITAEGPNTSDSAGTVLGTAGYGALDTLSGGTTFDANILDITFTTDTGDLFFNYVFGSEEYNEFVLFGVNDAFGFFIDGVNIAIAPDGSEVAIDTVNCGNPFGSADNNCSSYNNNDPTDGGPFFDIEYDGFTDVFTASILGLSAGQHVLTLAIADTGDPFFDSGVFIERGSFMGTNPGNGTNPIPEPASTTLFGAGLFLVGAGIRRRR